MKRLITILSLLLPVCLVASGQEQLIRQESVSKRQRTILAVPENPEKVRAAEVVNRIGLPTRLIHPDGRIVEIRRLSPDGKPEYLTTHNLNAARTVSTDKVWQSGGSGYNLSGDGIVVGIWDGGVLRSTHREFEGRAIKMNPSASVEDHSTHVSGTIGAAGIDGNAHGMANRAILEGYDWNNDLAEMSVAAGDGLLLSNHSYGYVIGWDYNIDLERWEWYGDTEISEEEDYNFGFYHPEAQENDRIARNNPCFLIVKSAGNDRGEGPGAGEGHYVWENGDWAYSTRIRQKDGGLTGFETMGPVSSAKNILVVGAIHDLTSGYQNSGDVKITSFSAFGPTDDGRIKPDLVANGAGLYSTYAGSDLDYGVSSGTSMSAPNVTGSLALLQELYYSLHHGYMKSASLKGLVLHTADEAGNPGPDYKFGWGVMNTLKAARIISDTSFQQVQERSLEEGSEIRIRMYSEGSEPVRATLCWTDLPGTVPEIALDPVDRILVNDLDLRIIRDSDGHMYLPFILDPDQPDNPATSGDNVRDNVEQVLIGDPEKGSYEIIITHKGALQEGKQDFSLVVSGLEEKFFASGEYTLTSNNGSFMLTSADEYLPDMHPGWLITPENQKPVSLYFDFLETEEKGDFLKVYDGPDSTATLLAEFSGTLADSDTLIRSTGGSMFVSFASDGQNQERGFRAIYCTTPPGGSLMVQGETYPCSGSFEAYAACGEDGARYQWIPPAGWDLEVNGDNSAVLEIGTDRNILEVLPYNRCGEAAGTGLSINPLLSPPSLSGLNGDTVLCAGDYGTLRVDSLPGAAFEWMLPDNWSGSSATHEIEYIPSAEAGLVSVTAYNSCGSGDTVSIPVQVNTIPYEKQILSVAGKICQNTPNSFYIVPEEGTGYTWSVSPGWQILGNDQGDTVDVMVGTDQGSVMVHASNQCGFTDFSRSFPTDPSPEVPLVGILPSEYENYMELEVQNATAYTSFQWYRDGGIIDGPGATGPKYVAFVPGVYTVGVTNREGCILQQALEDGIRISGPDHLYAVYAGAAGSIIVENTTGKKATLNVYDMGGNLLMIEEIDAGHNEIPTHLLGAYIVSVNGPDELHVFRIFIQ
jgi:hypothetical protein